MRMCVTTDMLQTIDMVLNLKAGATTQNILDEIFAHLRKQRIVPLDIAEFAECKQAPGEKFDAFHIRLQQVAKCAELCPHCYDRRMTSRIMSGIRAQEAPQEAADYVSLSRPEFSCYYV